MVRWSGEGQMMVRLSSGDSQVSVISQKFSELDIAQDVKLVYSTYLLFNVVSIIVLMVSIWQGNSVTVLMSVEDYCSHCPGLLASGCGEADGSDHRPSLGP